METTDRFKQMSWLRELAGNIAANLGEGTAEELVEYALSHDGLWTWNIEAPSWFDEHDQRLLTNMVRRRIA